MPIYVYLCSSCATRSEIRHGIEEGPPDACPACGATGTLRKSFAAPAIVFKGSGWAKKERRVAPASAGASEAKDGEPKEGASTGDGGTGGSDGGTGATGDDKPAAPKPDQGAGTGKASDTEPARPSSPAGGASRSSGTDAD